MEAPGFIEYSSRLHNTVDTLSLQKHLPTKQTRYNSHRDHQRPGVYREEGCSSTLLAIAEVDTIRKALIAKGDVLLNSLVDTLASREIEIRQVVLFTETGIVSFL